MTLGSRYSAVDVEEKKENPFPDWPDAAEFIAKHQMGVWRYLRAIGCDSALADDLTQDTFLAVLRKPFEFVSDAASAGYLRRVAYHLLVTARRRSSRLMVTDSVELFEKDWARWAGFDSGESAMDALQECFDRLTKRAKLSLRMRFGESASRDAIAAALGITEHGAKNLMQRAKNQLRECVESKLK
jgi:RNA polymerase sigma-70 factor, ECF subfamily